MNEDCKEKWFHFFGCINLGQSVEQAFDTVKLSNALLMEFIEYTRDTIEKLQKQNHPDAKDYSERLLVWLPIFEKELDKRRMMNPAETNTDYISATDCLAAQNQMRLRVPKQKIYE